MVRWLREGAVNEVDFQNAALRRPVHAGLVRPVAPKTFQSAASAPKPLEPAAGKNYLLPGETSLGD
jgi:hypothetical protein